MTFRMPRQLLVFANVVVVVGCDAGVDFAAVVEGHQFGRSGAILTQSGSVIVDFSEPDVVTLTAEIKNGATVTDSADAACDRGAAEQGLFETRLPADNCVFEFVITSAPQPPEAPTSLVIGFRNAEADGSVEIDPSLEEALPVPFSFADDYSRLDRAD